MSNESKSWESLDQKTNSDIQQFYTGKHVFLTGSTGSLGTLMLERLLYWFLDIGKIYLMIRPKRNVSAEERLAKLFEDNIFDLMRKKNPNFMEKLVIVHGELKEPSLGLSPQDRKVLLDNVNIIIHNASLVKFVARPRETLRANVMGTKDMLELAEKCSHLEAFVYVSTAYSHMYKEIIEEKFYPPPADLKTIEDIIRADETPDGLSEEAVKDIVGDFVNIYAFSKATTEGVIETFAKTAPFPCIVYRPSTVVTTLDESLPPWIGNKNGPVGLNALVYTGIVHALCINENNLMDVIPIDMTVNYLLALIWNHVTSRRPADVYNYGSSDWYPLVFKRLIADVFLLMRKYPSKRAVWYPFLITTKNYYVFLGYNALFDMIPAAIVDLALLVCKRQKPKYFKMVWSTLSTASLYQKFMNFQWIIKTDKAKELVKRMNPADRKAFNFDVGSLNLDVAFSRYLDSVRCVLKETPDDLEIARARDRKLKILHYTVCSVIVFLVLLLLYYFVCCIVS